MFQRFRKPKTGEAASEKQEQKETPQAPDVSETLAAAKRALQEAEAERLAEQKRKAAEARNYDCCRRW